MRARSSTRYALFLVLLVLGQEFSLARYATNERMLAHARQDTEQRKNTIDNEEYNGEENDSENSKDDERETGLQLAQPQKRFSVAFNVAILAVQLGFSIASLSAEIYYKINGCCGSHEKVCTYRDDIKDIEKRLEHLSKATDKVAAEALTLKEYVLQTSDQLSSMWSAMKDIVTYEEELVEILDPDITTQFTLKYSEIEKQLIQKNVTVQEYTYDQLNEEYQSLFDSFEGRLISMAPFLGYGLMIAGMVGFKMYKTKQINKLIDEMSTGEGYKQLVRARHTRQAKIMGIDKVGLNTYIKNYATKEINAKYGGAKAKWTVRGLSVAAAGVSAAFDVLAIIAKVEQCDEIENNLRDGKDKMVAVENEIKELLSNTTEYLTFLQEDGWGFLKNQTTNSTFQIALEDIKELVVNADNKNAALETAIVNMGLFLSNINKTVVSDNNATYYLIKNVATGLQSVKFKMECFVNRGRLIKHLLDQCKVGAGNLTDLYNDGIKTFGTHGDFCFIDDQGTPYTSYDAVEATVKNVSVADGYNADCILNNQDKLNQACSHSNDGYGTTWIANKLLLAVTQAQYFLARCPEPELTPLEKQQICQLKAMSWTVAAITSFLKRKKEETVQKYMDTGCS